MEYSFAIVSLELEAHSSFLFITFQLTIDKTFPLPTSAAGAPRPCLRGATGGPSRSFDDILQMPLWRPFIGP